MRIMKMKFGNMDTPYPEITNSSLSSSQYEKKRLVSRYKILLHNIPSKISRYPLATYFLTEDFVRDRLMKAKSSVVFEKQKYMANLPGFLKHCTFSYSGEEWMLLFRDSDFEDMDILTNYFTEDRRIVARLRNRDPPYIFLERNMDRVISAAIDYAIENHINLNAKAVSEALYTLGVKVCTTFKPSLGVAVFGEVLRSKRVFDPFAGWGDRALAAFMSEKVEYYKGIDVNSSLKNNYDRMGQFLTDLKPQKDISFEISAIENIDMEKEITGQDIDTIFSSPPFFDFEIYSNDLEQSTNKYKARGEWLNEWLIPITTKMISCLKNGGKLAYYMGGNEKDIVLGLVSGLEKENVEFMGQIAVGNGVKRPLFLFVWEKRGQ